MKNHETLFTTTLSRFIDYTLREDDNAQIDLQDALVLSELNSGAIHIQFTTNDGTKSLAKPLLWRKQAWMKDSERRAKVIDELRFQKQIADKQKGNLDRTTKLIALKTKMSYDDAYEIASAIVLKGDHTFLEILGIKIEEISEQEKQRVGTYDIKDGRVVKKIL